MGKPSIAVLQQMYRLDEKIKELQGKRNEVQDKLFEKYGEQTFCYDLRGKIANKQFGRIKITDNCAKVKRGEIVWKSTPFTGADVDIAYLKNKPKEMV